MSVSTAIVQGTLKPDGTLELDEKLNLPAGRVQVVVQPLPELPDDDPFWQRMKAVWADQRARGHVPRAREEIDADLAAADAEAEEEMQAVERVQLPRQG
jgi:hypothetical protein